MHCFAKYKVLFTVSLIVLFGAAEGQKKVAQILRVDSVGILTAVRHTAHQFDSLKMLIDGAPDDTLKVNRLNILFGVSAPRRMPIALKAKKLAEQLRFYPGLANACVRVATCFEEENNFSAATDLCLQAVAIDEMHKCYRKIFEHYAALLNLYFYTGDFPAAMKFTTRALSTAEKIGNPRMIAEYNSLFGFIYLREGNFGESKKYYNRYLNLAKQLSDSLMIADACNCMGDVYTGLQQYNVALNYFFKAWLSYSNPSNAGDFQLYEEGVLNKKERLAYTFYKISSGYKLNRKYDAALEFADSCFKYANAGLSNKYDLAAYYNNSGDIYRHLKDYSTALMMLNKGLAMAKQIQHREDTRDAYASLAETYAAMHRYDSAYFFSLRYTLLKDSIVNEESQRKVAEVQAQYDTEKKDQEAARTNFLRNLFIAALLVVVTILFLLYSRYLLKQKNKYQGQVNKQQSELFNAVVSAQDKERKRIAQDIHDSLGSVLSAAKLNLSGLEEEKSFFTKEQKKKYETSLALLDEASAELRTISHNLMPATLLKLGLIAALQNLFDRISSTGLRIHFTTHDVKERLEEATEISIYRIMLELVNNIVKHAGASEITVQIIRYPAYINITIEDDGHGFDYAQTAADTKGMGLSNILSRIEYLKGTLDVDSGKGTGTTVIIEIPLDGNTNGTV